MIDDVLESRLLRFEEAWARGVPAIADFLADPPVTSSSDRGRLLAELIALDLEFRWREGPRGPGRSARRLLEHYLIEFPELGPRDGLPLELIGEEYRVRLRWGDRPSHEEILARFPGRAGDVRAELLRIDGELARESPASEPEVGETRPSGPPEEIPGLPRLSHRDFLLRRLIGAGRIGKVYEARMHATGRPVAVKFLRKVLLRESGIVRRFVGEARTVAGLVHPRIVGARGFGRTAAGSCFIVMDLVAGPDLARIIAARTIAVADAVRWTAEACEALDHAHERGVIHCDLKPANLLLDEAGGIRVTDFGLARSLTGKTPWAAEVEGTAPFMAPEQVSRCWGRIDRRTDVYGIGAVLFMLLTGRAPYVGRRVPDILSEVVGAAPIVDPRALRPELPGEVAEACRICLAKPPHERYQTIGEVRTALLGLVGSDDDPSRLAWYDDRPTQGR